MNHQNIRDASLAWVEIIDRCSRLCYRHRDIWSDNPDFLKASTQALKSKLAYKQEKQLLLDAPNTLVDLVTPFFIRTTYPTDIEEKQEIKCLNGKSRTLQSIWRAGPDHSVPSVIEALGGLIEMFPDIKNFSALKADILAEGALLPQDLQDKLGISAIFDGVGFDQTGILFPLSASG